MSMALMQMQPNTLMKKNPSEASEDATPEPSSPPGLFDSERSATPPKQRNNTPPLKVGSSDSGSVTMQPVLYSAIGSLENASVGNMGSFRTKILNAGKQSALYGNQRQPLLQQQGLQVLQPQTKLWPPVNHAVSSTSSSTALLLPPIAPSGNGLASALERAASEKSSTQDDVEIFGDEKKTSPGIASALERAAYIKTAEEKKTLEKSDLPATSTGAAAQITVPSILKKKDNAATAERSKRVSIADQKSRPVEMFRPSCDAYTPRIKGRAHKFVNPEARTLTETSSMGTISRPNFRNALKRVAMILHQHIDKIEERFESKSALFLPEMRDLYDEEAFVLARYKCALVRVPMAIPGVMVSQKKIVREYSIPTADEIYDFAELLFKKVQLSSECSIVCLIYVERLMESAKVPLLANTWRPIFLCGLLLASKVWQDLSSWNVEFAHVYPQFTLEAINRLELQFLKHIQWDLYISSSLYAKYYFALRSLLEKKDFRQRYNRMAGVDRVAASEALKVQQRTEMVKEEALLQQLSKSM